MRSQFVRVESVWLLCCVLNLLNGTKREEVFLYSDCRVRTRTRSKCAWWLSTLIQKLHYRCWWQISSCRSYLVSEYKSHKILWHFNSPRRKILLEHNRNNFTIIFYERWEIENKIELCENCWTQKMRFLDRISVRFGRMAKAISSINCRLE